jgi:hypothetical protein
MRRKSSVLLASILVLLGPFGGATPAQAASSYTVGGWIELNGADDFTHEMTNPEANFEQTCGRGDNGWAPWMRVGARFPVFNGVGIRVGSVKITQADWVEDYGLKGNCYYYMSGKGLKRANFYCIGMPNDHIWEIGSSSKAKNGFVEVDLWLINDTYETPYADRECGGTW